MLAEIFMLRCEAAARNTQSEYAATKAGARARWVFMFTETIGLRRKLATAWTGLHRIILNRLAT